MEGKPERSILNVDHPCWSAGMACYQRASTEELPGIMPRCSSRLLFTPVQVMVKDFNRINNKGHNT